MPKRSIFLATANSKAIVAIAAYFSGTESIPSVIRSKGDYTTLFSSKPDFVFFQGDWVDSKTVVRLVQFKDESPKTKFFSLGETNSAGFVWDGSIEFPIDEKAFRKTILAKAEFPDPIRLLVISKQPQLMGTIKDYFEARQNPGFRVMEAAEETKIAKHFESNPPHCLMVDSSTFDGGAELFRRFEKKGFRIPAIVFTHMAAADQILGIRKWKAPVFMELNHVFDSMPDLLAVVKKLVIFS